MQFQVFISSVRHLHCYSSVRLLAYLFISLMVHGYTVYVELIALPQAP